MSVVSRRSGPAAGFDRRWRVLDAIERLAARYGFPAVTDAVQEERRAMVRRPDPDEDDGIGMEISLR